MFFRYKILIYYIIYNSTQITFIWFFFYAYINNKTFKDLNKLKKTSSNVGDDLKDVKNLQESNKALNVSLKALNNKIKEKDNQINESFFLFW